MSARGFLHRHSLGLTVLAVFAAFTVAVFVIGYHQYQARQVIDGEPFTWRGYQLWVAFNYLVALVSGSFNALLLVTATKWLREIGSAESRDPRSE